MSHHTRAHFLQADDRAHADATLNTQYNTQYSTRQTQLVNNCIRQLTMKSSFGVALALFAHASVTTGFLQLISPTANYRTSNSQVHDSSRTQEEETIDPNIAEKFKIVACMSTSCSKRRKDLGMDSLATFGAFYSRAQNGNAPSVRVEEGPCLGSCKMAPCVAVEHDDFDGSVSLEGMSDSEFSDRV